MASSAASVYRKKGHVLFTPNITDSGIDSVKKFTYRDDDILIVTYPKCGTHWINEVIQLMIHNGDPDKLDYRHRRVCLEITDVVDFSKTDQEKPSVELVNTDPSPRVLTTHLPTSYLSEETWKKRVPIVYIFRDPRDVCLSFYNFMKEFLVGENEPLFIDFKQFLSEFIDGKVPYSGWCEHALSYEDCWKKGENILFISYEDMKQDLPSVIKTVAKHIGRQVSNKVVGKVVANSTVEAMLRNYKDTGNKTNNDVSRFVKKGVSGQWKVGHSEDEWRELNKVFKEKVKNSEFAKKYFD